MYKHDNGSVSLYTLGRTVARIETAATAVMGVLIALSAVIFFGSMFFEHAIKSNPMAVSIVLAAGALMCGGMMGTMMIPDESGRLRRHYQKVEFYQERGGLALLINELVIRLRCWAFNTIIIILACGGAVSFGGALGVALVALLAFSIVGVLIGLPTAFLLLATWLGVKAVEASNRFHNIGSLVCGLIAAGSTYYFVHNDIESVWLVLTTSFGVGVTGGVVSFGAVRGLTIITNWNWEAQNTEAKYWLGVCITNLLARSDTLVVWLFSPIMKINPFNRLSTNDSPIDEVFRDWLRCKTHQYRTFAA